MHSQLTTGTQGSHKDPGKQGHQERGAGFPVACGVTLWACPVESLGILMYPIQLLTENMSLTGLLTTAPQQTTSLRGPIPLPSHSARPTMAAHSAGTKQPHSSPGGDMELDRSGDEPGSHPKELPKWRQKEGDPLEGWLKGAHQEAFGEDSKPSKVNKIHLL